MEICFQPVFESAGIVMLNLLFPIQWNNLENPPNPFSKNCKSNIEKGFGNVFIM